MFREYTPFQSVSKQNLYPLRDTFAVCDEDVCTFCFLAVGNTFQQLYDWFHYWTAEHLDKSYTMNEFAEAHLHNKQEIMPFRHLFPEEYTYCLCVVSCFLSLQSRKGYLEDNHLSEKVTENDCLGNMDLNACPDLTILCPSYVRYLDGCSREESSENEESLPEEEEDFVSIRIHFVNQEVEETALNTREMIFLHYMLSQVRCRKEAFQLGQFFSTQLTEEEFESLPKDEQWSKYLEVGYYLEK